MRHLIYLLQFSEIIDIKKHFGTWKVLSTNTYSLVHSEDISYCIFMNGRVLMIFINFIINYKQMQCSVTVILVVALSSILCYVTIIFCQIKKSNCIICRYSRFSFRFNKYNDWDFTNKWWAHKLSHFFHKQKEIFLFLSKFNVWNLQYYHCQNSIHENVLMKRFQSHS